MTFGSLFAGVGGFDLGFERAGMQCKWQVEIDDYANQVLAKHWPDARRHRDIRTFPPSSADDWRVDVVVGGFPCQDISYAGRGAGLAGERSGLFYEAVRVVRVLEPRVVVLENVAALLTRGLDDVLGTLASLGYDAEWHCIPAAAVGAPHIRDRVFIVAVISDTLRTECQSGSRGRRIRQSNSAMAGVHPDSTVSVGNESADVGQVSKSQQRKSGRVCCSLPDTIGTRLEVQPRQPGDDGEEQQAAQRNGNGWEWWATEPAVGRVAHGVPSRVDRLRCLGNAVVPQVAELIARWIMEAEYASA